MADRPKKSDEEIFDWLCEHVGVPEVGQDANGQTTFLYDICIPTSLDDPDPVEHVEPDLPKPPPFRHRD